MDNTIRKYDISKIFKEPVSDADVMSIIDNPSTLILRKEYHVNGDELVTMHTVIIDFDAGLIYKKQGRVGRDYTKLDSEPLTPEYRQEVCTKLKNCISDVERIAETEPMMAQHISMLLMAQDGTIKKYYCHDVSQLQEFDGFVDSVIL